MPATSEATPIARLLRPRSVAIVGASPESGSIGGAVLANLEHFRYGGAIHLVSRSRAEINGRPCVPSIDDLPLGIDAIALVVPEAAVLDAVAACVRRKAGGAVVFASGFSETGDAGRAKQEKLAAIAREGGLALNGPNCLGFVNFLDGVPLTFEFVGEYREPPASGVAVIGQSGAMVGNIRSALVARGIPVAHAVSTGNEAALGVEDFLGELVGDKTVSLFALFIEQIRRPALFLDLVARARALGKPVALLHPGRTARSRESAKSHTGALAGNHALMRTTLTHRGVVVVDTLDELFDVAALLARWPEPPARGAGVITNSGAFRGLALDLGVEIGLDFPALAGVTVDALKPMFPPYASIDNPLDTTTLAFSKPEIFAVAAKALLDDPGIGSLMISVVAGPPRIQVAKSDSILPVMAAAGKPVAFVMMGDQEMLVEEFNRAIRSSGLPLFRSPDRAMRALVRIADCGRALEAASSPARASGLAPIPLTESGAIAEYRAKRWLAAAGIRVPEGALARNIEEAQQIAARVGYPVAAKAQASALTHKSDAGGVMLGIADANALCAAWERLQQDVRRAQPDLALDGVLVERMAEPGLEMFVGARRDPDWGVVLMVGLGGVWIEALEDVRLLPPGLGEAAIIAEIRKLKGARLLGGIRGAPPLDELAVARTVAIVAELMQVTPRLSEIDINPLVVYPAGEGVQALDALINTAAA